MPRVPGRQSGHGLRFRISPIVEGINVTRGEARAIEQALIERYGRQKLGGAFENDRNSINPNHDYYNKAVAWGESWLKYHGI
jgi:hypothetical protein